MDDKTYLDRLIDDWEVPPQNYNGFTVEPGHVFYSTDHPMPEPVAILFAPRPSWYRRLWAWIVRISHG